MTGLASVDDLRTEYRGRCDRLMRERPGASAAKLAEEVQAIRLLAALLRSRGVDPDPLPSLATYRPPSAAPPLPAEPDGVPVCPWCGEPGRHPECVALFEDGEPDGDDEGDADAVGDECLFAP